MASERNRILDVLNYVESCGIEVNIGKNKARGNKGFFENTSHIQRRVGGNDTYMHCLCRADYKQHSCYRC